VLASVVEHASTAPGEQKCFLTQDAKDFATQKIFRELSRHRCKVIVNFDDAAAYLAKQLPPAT
jgi:hypothetical protein